MFEMLQNKNRVFWFNNVVKNESISTSPPHTEVRIVCFRMAKLIKPRRNKPFFPSLKGGINTALFFF
jgi:hypothetical protein